jgi:cyclopropane fatty-acyl-phospholipid synthase-like methyltransferase
MQIVQVRAGQETVVDLRPDRDRTSSSIVFHPTPDEVVEIMLELAEVKKDDVVYDLGCGDGRIVVMAAKKFGARGIGVDIDPKRVREAEANIKKAGVEGQVEIRQGDALQVEDLSRATVVTLYMLPEFMAKLEPVLQKHLKPGARIVAHDYPMPDWKPALEVEVLGPRRPHLLYLWKVEGGK